MNLPWHHGVHMMHRFEHPEYATYVHKTKRDALGLRL